MHNNTQDNLQMNRRLIVFFIIAFIILVLFLLQLLAISLFGKQIVGASDGNDKITASYVTSLTIPAKRGEIYDNSGDTPFAETESRYDIVADQINAKNWFYIDCNKPHKGSCSKTKDGSTIEYDGVQGLAILLEGYLGIDRHVIAYNLYGNSRHKVLAKGVTPEVTRQITALGISFINVRDTTSRRYPQGNIAGSLIGSAVSTESGKVNAVAGIEAVADDILAGVDGKIEYEAANGGMRIPQGQEKEIVKVQNGKDIKASIDYDVQQQLQQSIEITKTNNKSDWVIAGVMKVKTGEILALSETGELIAGSDDVRDTGSPVMKEMFEPGSTMKSITTTGLINDGVATPTSRYNLPNQFLTIAPDPEPIQDYASHPAGEWTLAGIIGNSYNTGTVIASYKWPLQNRYDTYTRYGIGSVTDSGFPGETPGMLQKPENWDGRTRNTVLFGQGVAVSALQMISAYGTIANKGIKVNPTFISATRDQGNGNNWTPYESLDPPEQIVSPEAAEQTLKIMEGCVVNFGCKSEKIPSYRIAGKTGTAQEPPTDKAVHSFIGVFPADDPQFVVGVFVCDHALGRQDRVEAPAFKEISQFLIHKYAVPTGASPNDLYPAR